MRKRKARYTFEERVWIFEKSIEVERLRTGKPPDRGRKRQKRHKATPEEIDRQNRYNREKLIRRIMKENFRENDIFGTYTYLKDHRPPDKEAALADRKKFLDIVRYEYKKRGYVLKWIARTERGKRGAVHHHIVVNRIPDGDLILTKAWRKVQGSGRAAFVSMYDKGGYADLAAYLVKPDTEDDQGRPATWIRYSHSRNLEIPEPTRNRTTRRQIVDPPQPLPGYYIDQDSIRQGTNKITGREYLHFTMFKLKRGRGRSQEGVSG